MAIPDRPQRGRVNEDQKMKLLEHMEGNPALSAGVATRSFSNSDRIRSWDKITLTLNSCGPSKDADSWRACWSDLKGGIKKKMARISKSMERYGRAEDIPFSLFEERVASLMGHSTLFVLGENLETGTEAFSNLTPNSSNSCTPDTTMIKEEVFEESENIIPETIIPDAEETFDQSPDDKTVPIVDKTIRHPAPEPVLTFASSISPVIESNTSETESPTRSVANGEAGIPSEEPSPALNSLQSKYRNKNRLARNLKRSRVEELDKASKTVDSFAAAQEIQATATKDLADSARKNLEIKERLAAAEERKAAAAEREAGAAERRAMAEERKAAAEERKALALENVLMLLRNKFHQ